MIRITTYRATPLLSPATCEIHFDEMNCDWFRKAINRIYNTNKSRLRKACVVTDIFHNHDEQTGDTKTGYPMIIYHKIDGLFYLTSINEGVDTVKELLADTSRPVEVDKNIYLKFEVARVEETEVDICATPRQFSITDCLPFRTNETNKTFLELRAVNEKIQFLENLLTTHIKNDFAKYLHLDLTDFQLSITDFDNLQRQQVKVVLSKHPHYFQPISLAIDINVNLPEFVCLGNNKALGYGRIMKLTAPSTPT